MLLLFKNCYQLVTSFNAHSAILGITRSASQKEIKTAYYALAKKYHPDNNPHLSSSTKFHEITQAYQILKNISEEKTQNQDQQYSESPKQRKEWNNNPFHFQEQKMFKAYQSYKKKNRFKGDTFKHFQQFFYKYYNKQKGQEKEDEDNQQENLEQEFQQDMEEQKNYSHSATHKRSTYHKKLQVVVDMNLTSEEANKGVQKTIFINRKIVCILCKGYPKVKKIKCKRCEGSGYKNTLDGYSICSACGGNKSFCKPTCDCCSGKGHIQKSTQEMIFIHPGVKNNEEIIIQGKGHQHIKRGFFGNLILKIKLEVGQTQQVPSFRKEGYNTFSNITISLLDAIFGTKLTYNTVWGSRTIALQAGVQNGDFIKRAGQGLKKKSKKQNGDHFLTLAVDIPKKLSSEALIIFQQLKDLQESKYKKYKKQSL